MPGPLWPSSPWRNLDPDESKKKRMIQQIQEIKSAVKCKSVKITVCPHSHDDDARLCDDVLGEFVEGGVRVIVEALQLLHHVVQLENRPERLAVEAGVHGRRVKLEDGVVLTQSLLHKLRET